MVSRRIRPGKGVALSSGGLALVLVAVMALMAARQKRDREHQTIDNLLDTGCSVSKLLRSHLNKVGDVEDDEVVCSEKAHAGKDFQAIAFSRLHKNTLRHFDTGDGSPMRWSAAVEDGVY